jgi:site-specific recombinase XerD
MSTALAIIEAPSLPATVVAAERDAARDFALNEKAESTRRAYRGDFAAFTTWCCARGLVALPASTDTVAAFLAAQANAGARASSIGRSCASIRYAHRLAGLEPPTGAESVKAVMRGIRRTIGTAKEQKAPATADRITDMLRGIPETLTGKRDRALLLLGFAGAFRRSELVGLQVADLTDAEDGIRVLIRHSKTDQEGQGQEIAIPHGHSLRPVAAVRAWLTAAGITDGPIFRPILKGGRVCPEALSDRSVATIIKAHAERAGLDPAEYAGHSLRAGYLTSAAEAGANVFKMMEVSRHKSIDTLRGYVRRSDLFRDHSGASFL